MGRCTGWIVATLGLLVASPLAAQTDRGQVRPDASVREALDVMETWLEAQMAYDQLPSYSAAIVHDQERVWSAAEGLAHPSSGAAATASTLYSICSISKLFTAVSVMQLRDEGQLTLRDPVAKHLPWYAVEQRHEGSPPVTIEGILTHSAGLPRESAHPYWTGPDFPFPTRDEVIDGLSGQETLYPARQYFQYSNLGLTLAGQIVEERSGVAYSDYVRTRVLQPLGMMDTYPEIPVEHRGGQLATGYGSRTREGRREEVAFFQAKGIAPAAGFASTANDLARFASWQFRLHGDTEEVLHAHTLDEMQRVHYVDPSWNTYWGLGFSVRRRGEETFVGHGGSCPGFRSQLLMQRDKRIAAVFMTNSMANAGGYAQGMYDLMQAAITQAAGAESADATVMASSDAQDNGMPGENGHGSMDGAGHADLQDYLGTYSGQPWGSETAVVKWKGGLALLGLPTMNPAGALRRLEHDEGDVFYRVRDDGERGEDVVFHRGPDGAVASFSVHGNHSRRIDP